MCHCEQEAILNPHPDEPISFPEQSVRPNASATTFDNSGFVVITRRIPAAQAVTELQEDLNRANDEIFRLKDTIKMAEQLRQDAIKRANAAEMDLEKALQELEAKEGPKNG